MPHIKSCRSGYVMNVMCQPNYTRSLLLADPTPRTLSVNISRRFYRVRRRVVPTFVTMSSDKEAVTEVLMKYEAGLNESSTEKVMELYTPDGVFMPQHNPSAVGAANVRAAYDGVFKALTLAVKFKVRRAPLARAGYPYRRTVFYPPT